MAEDLVLRVADQALVDAAYDRQIALVLRVIRNARRVVGRAAGAGEVGELLVVRPDLRPAALQPLAEEVLGALPWPDCRPDDEELVGGGVVDDRIGLDVVVSGGGDPLA